MSSENRYGPAQEDHGDHRIHPGPYLYVKSCNRRSFALGFCRNSGAVRESMINDFYIQANDGDGTP